MELSEAVLRVQQAFPQVYLACHSRHQNARTTAANLSQRDASLMAHLSEKDPTPQAFLALHLGVAKSTLSAALSGLESRGFILRRGRSESDPRASLVFRTPAGTRAMSAGSVLEADRLRGVLKALTGDERVRAIEGLELIAGAAQKITMRKQKAKERTHERSRGSSEEARVKIV